MTKRPNYEGIRTAWLRNAGAEAQLWLAHIRAKADLIIERQRSGLGWTFEEGELLFNVFAFLNWLAHIDLRESRYVAEPTMISWLQTTTLWPKEVCEAFWFCLRNPVMHTGQASVFSDYERKTAGFKLFAGLHPDLNFDPLAFQPDEFKPTEVEDGFVAVVGPFKDHELNVNFYFPGVMRKMERALGDVTQRIANADNNSLSALRKVNQRILIFRVWGGSDAAD